MLFPYNVKKGALAELQFYIFSNNFRVAFSHVYMGSDQAWWWAESRYSAIRNYQRGSTISVVARKCFYKSCLARTDRVELVVGLRRVIDLCNFSIQFRLGLFVRRIHTTLGGIQCVSIN